jgi:hypothetical protein
MTLVLTALLTLTAASAVQGDHSSAADLRGQIETWTAVLDSQTRRLYYDIRDELQGRDEHSQLLSDARELWRAARRINDRVMDGVSSTKLEREVRHVEQAFHAVEERADELRHDGVMITPLRRRLRRIDDLVHAAHDGIHDLSDLESGAPNGRASQPPIVSPRPAGPRRVEEIERRATEYANPPSVRVGPDGFYFDGRRFTIPLGR